MREKLKALVIGDDHENTLNVIRALGKEHIEVKVAVISRNKESFVLRSRYVNKGYCINSITVDKIIEWFAEPDVKIPVLATSDSMAAFLDTNYDVLSQYFILPSVKCVQGYLLNEMNKEIQLQHAKKAGFDIPFSKSLDLKTDYRNNIHDIPFPCLIKPEESIYGCKDDFRICNDSSELKLELDALSKHLNKVLVQKFIPNDEVIVVSGVRTLSGENYIFGEINKLKHSKNLGYLGLNCLGVLRSETPMRDACLDYVNSIDYHGCFSIDIVRVTPPDNNMPVRNYFMEINLRTDGLLYLYNKAGINFPAIWVSSCYNYDIDINPSTKDIYGMNESLYMQQAMSGQFLKDLIKADTFSTFSTNDIKPFIHRFFSRINYMIKK